MKFGAEAGARAEASKLKEAGLSKTPPDSTLKNWQKTLSVTCGIFFNKIARQLVS